MNLLKNGETVTICNRYTSPTIGSPQKARRPNADEPGKLEVAFFGNFYGDYYVLELADDYRYALVGSKTNKYLWILSRTPEMTEDDLSFVLQRIRERGYDESKLIWVK